MKNIPYLQGDIRLDPVLEIPKTAKKIKTKVVAYGEVTGHHHRFENEGVDLYQDGKDMYLQVSVQSPFIHEEHKRKIIEPGLYKIENETEFDYFEADLKKVVD